jgi:hypothetical protein
MVIFDASPVVFVAFENLDELSEDGRLLASVSEGD